MAKPKLLWFLGLSMAASPLAEVPAHAAPTGTCNLDDAHELACVNAIKALGPNTVIADVFRDKAGHTGDMLGVYGKLIDPFNGCGQTNTICNGDLTNSQGRPAVVCQNANRDIATVGPYVNALDWKYGNFARLHKGHGALPGNALCPDWRETLAEAENGYKDGYLPWEGMVFDLQGPANKVVLFPVNDHPDMQPCESVEYSVYLTDNPASREVVENPTTTGADPNKWNRARLSTMYLEGWKKVRPGQDLALGYTIEGDSFTTVWSMPCGIAFRYVGLIAGNDGKQPGLDACNFDSYDGEIDAVAGLTEEGIALCPDADHDGFADCECPQHPQVCDCDDSNPKINPAASESCGGVDANCDGIVDQCTGGLICYQSNCVPICGTGEFSGCSAGSSCVTRGEMPSVCVPDTCDKVQCPAGSVCDPATKVCAPVCTGVQCPEGQECRAGRCLDLCRGVRCPNQQTCDRGQCKARCDCFEGNTGCESGKLCNAKDGQAACVSQACLNQTCGEGTVCNAQGACVGQCDGVTCPSRQKCVIAGQSAQCVTVCLNGACPQGLTCNPDDGTCVKPSEICTPACAPPRLCYNNTCIFNQQILIDGGVDPDAGVDANRAEGCGCEMVGKPDVRWTMFSALWAVALFLYGVKPPRLRK